MEMEMEMTESGEEDHETGNSNKFLRFVIDRFWALWQRIRIRIRRYVSDRTYLYTDTYVYTYKHACMDVLCACMSYVCFL
jgi:hypothetical protein